MTAAEIRQAFLSFFQSKGHEIVPSAPIVVKNDPTLLFTNAGMNQFKDYFLGNRKPPFVRVADVQKCLRVSGKHNDLEEVGVDTYHHTMFEMLGNWSFGDYFKQEAIAWSWELLTEVYQIEKDRLYVSVFEGDAAEGLPFDQEAYQEWQKWVPESRIIKGKKKDNFWEMGDTGPCGPSSEIHVDCRPDAERQEVDGATLVNEDHPQVIEIWNNVFIEFNRLKDGSLQPLPQRHVDTGMGFERLVRVLQGKESNYDTDVFSGTIQLIAQLTGRKYRADQSGEAIAFRVLSDHIRAVAFTIADGQLPANTGAGYVIRRILRRAVRYYYSSLQYEQPLLCQLVPLLAAQFASVYPELSLQQEFVARVIREEEEAFLRTLEKGIRRFEEYYAGLFPEAVGQRHVSSGILGAGTRDVIDEMQRQQHPQLVIDGKFAFELYDTYGFPLDLTALMAQEVNARVDEAGFREAMKEQKQRSRSATTVDADDWVVLLESEDTAFVGYSELMTQTRVVKYRKVSAKNKTLFQWVLERTPFYPEGGGQVGDRGALIFGDTPIPVVDTRKENDLIIHVTERAPESVGGKVVARVDSDLRTRTCYNHSATHLLHAALRKVLGDHVAQKGSLVSPQLLRFDFTHFNKMTDDELREVQYLVNEKIRENVPVEIREMQRDEAVSAGATALFGEKYGDRVRVVTLDPGYSVELCGGTHVAQSGMIGVFTIVSETAVAAGVRRIEAVTGATALHFLLEKAGENKAIGGLLKSKTPLASVEKLLEEKAALEKKLERLEARRLVEIRNDLLQKDEMISVTTTGGREVEINFIGELVEVSHPDALKKLCFELNHHLRDHVAVLAANINGKAFVALGMSEQVAGALGIDAGKMIREIVAPLIGGGGGGQKILATAGGQQVSRLREAIDAVRAAVRGAV